MRTLLSIVLVFFYFSASQSVAQENEKMLRIGIGQEFDSINPLATTMLSALYIYNMVARNFLKLDADMKWHPDMVDEVPTLKNKLAEIKTINGNKKIVSRWMIRANAKWGDGVDITCEDVKFTWTLGRSNNATVVNRDMYLDIESIHCDSKKPKLIEMTHATLRWDFYKLFQFYIMPKHLEEPVFTKYGNEKEGFDRNSNYVKNPSNPGLYSGPYVITEVKLGSHVLLKRNPLFYGKKPYFDKILIRSIQDTTALETNLISKQVDMIATIGLNIDQALNIEKRAAKENLPFEVRYVSGFTYEHLDLKLENPILKSKNVRKALLLSIDRESMTKALFEGKQVIAPHFLSPRDPWFAKLPKALQKPAKYSKKEAEKLLESDGWKMGPDGYRYKDGKKLSIVLTTTTGNRTRENVQVYIIDQWKKVGIEAVTKNVPPRVFFSEIGHRKHEGASMFAWTFVPELPMTKFYSTKAIPSEANGWAGRNYSGYSNPKLDTMLETLEVEMSESKRQELVNQIVDIYTNEHITVPLFYRVDVSVVPKGFKGYNPSGSQQLETLFVENWGF
jgi:peptide/nickel transport system substrate-binding protein